MLRRALRSVGLIHLNRQSLITTKQRINYAHLPSLTTVPRYNFTSTSGPSQVAVLEQVQGKIFQVLKMAAKCNQQKLSKTATFQQLGFDSLDSVELIVAMEELFGFDITNQQAQRISTVDQAIKVFYKHMNDRIANKLSNPTAADVQQGSKK